MGVLETERLEDSISRLEEAVTARIVAAQLAADQVVALEKEIEVLKLQLQALQGDKDSLRSAVHDKDVEYRILEKVTDTVRDRLDDAIGRLRKTLSA